LLLTDDGTWLHALTSPRRHVPKRYMVTTADPLTPAMIQALLTGVMLHDETVPLAASECLQTSPHQLFMTITQGKYHQVKRMLAAVGNRVTTLHRAAMGRLEMGDLAEGQWRYLTPDECGLSSQPIPT
jgi:16S rRNA pseudouridine516 synthase